MAAKQKINPFRQFPETHQPLLLSITMIRHRLFDVVDLCIQNHAGIEEAQVVLMLLDRHERLLKKAIEKGELGG